ncbi:hypothetical protein [Vibrio campbellii]|uniref:hypothetical protein n=1 Tax=Vibrio campbellii TaxID=680 RepID=UPI00210E6A61|nr:hypothetical protein [Vibrio campbellii]UTZ44623.1 hypothetical protein HB764_25525 [Vibrio campbellii]
MITKVVLPTKEQLEPLVIEANEATNDEFVYKHLSGIKSMLTANPSMYRLYGAYWWSVKALLVEYGFYEWTSDEPITREHFNFDEPEYLLAAAWAYHNHQLESGVMVSNLHSYEVDSEPYEYALEDMDIELLIRSTKKK